MINLVFDCFLPLSARVQSVSIVSGRLLNFFSDTGASIPWCKLSPARLTVSLDKWWILWKTEWKRNVHCRWQLGSTNCSHRMGQHVWRNSCCCKSVLRNSCSCQKVTACPFFCYRIPLFWTKHNSSWCSVQTLTFMFSSEESVFERVCVGFCISPHVDPSSDFVLPPPRAPYNQSSIPAASSCLDFLPAEPMTPG